MSTVRPLHLPWSPLFATAVVLWVVGEPMLARKSSIFPPAPKTSPVARETAVGVDRIVVGRAPRLSNFSIGEPVAL
jgi:hypothetical protein